MLSILNANALHIPLAPECVQCVVTSPPYYGLRDYGVAGQIGLEQTPAEYVENMVNVFREVRRVLRPDGTLWLNLGDSYASDTKGSGGSNPDKSPLQSAKGKENFQSFDSRKFTHDVKTKDLLGIPWRVAFALQADGWYLRSDIIWHKPNPMPESVTDRPTKSHEYMFLLTKSARYYYDAEAVKEKAETAGGGCASSFRGNGANRQDRDFTEIGTSGQRNRRTVWTIATSPYSGAHFATFPPALVEPCILAGTSERGQCPACGAPWVRVVERETPPDNVFTGTYADDIPDGMVKMGFNANGGKRGSGQKYQNWLNEHPATTTGWRPSCTCTPAEPVPQLVFDPFSGTATVGKVAISHRRSYVGTELNPAYIGLALDRVDGTQISMM
jgi:DNA modification methylase